MSDKSYSSNGTSFTGLLFLVFLILKLTGYITWSWWWITAPLWGGFSLFVVVVGIVFFFTWRTWTRENVVLKAQVAARAKKIRDILGPSKWS